MKQTDATLSAWLAAAVAAGGPYDPAALFMGVATAVTDNGGATVQGNVTAATGAMATRQAITAWSDPYKLADGRWVVDGPLLSFAPASSSEAQTISHFFLNSAATAGTLKAFAALPSPRTLVDETRHLGLVMRLTIDPLGRFSDEVYLDA